MNCDRVQDLLSEAIDGALSPDDARDFHAHLAACPPCRAAFGDVKESLTLLTELPTVEVGAGFDEAVWRRIRAEARPALGVGARWRGWLAWIEAGGAWLRWAPLGAAAVALGWVAMSSDPAQMARSAAETDQVASTETRTPETVPGAGASAGDFTAPGVVETVAPEFTPVEYSAGIPQAVEQFLQSDARLNARRYRQSSYHYPIRPVQDPVIIPVSTGIAPAVPPDPSPPSTESGVPVLAF